MTLGRVIVVLLLVISPAYADLGPFQISAPDGWKELTSLPPDALAQLPPAIAEQLKLAHYELMAMDFEHPSGGFTPSMNVIVNSGDVRVTSSSLQKLGDGVLAQMTRGGMTAVLLSSRIVRIDGVNTARLEFDSMVANIQMHQLMYVMPGGDRTAVVTFAASPAQFQRYERLFDSTAEASRGLTEPSRFDWSEPALAGLLGGIGAAVFGLMRKQNKSRQAA